MPDRHPGKFGVAHSPEVSHRGEEAGWEATEGEKTENLLTREPPEQLGQRASPSLADMVKTSKK